MCDISLSLSPNRNRNSRGRNRGQQLLQNYYRHEKILFWIIEYVCDTHLLNYFQKS